MSELFFETIKIDKKQLYNIPYHKQRIYHTIGKTYPLELIIDPPSFELLKCKVIYSNKEIIDIEYQPYKKKEIRSFKIIYDNTIEYNYKYLNRGQIENLYNEKGDCDEIIILKNNLLTDTSIANICLYKEGSWYTPKKPLLFGTQRQKLIEQNKLIQADLTVDDLKIASGLALCNAMVGFDQIPTYTLSH